MSALLGLDLLTPREILGVALAFIAVGIGLVWLGGGIQIRIVRKR